MDREFGRHAYDPRDQGDFERGLVFVIMSFMGEGATEVLSVIKEECRALNLRAVRVDENIGSGFVIREITELIERAEFIVCDLSGERPNVYHELGYAHGVGNEAADILLIAREDSTLHFDIAPLRVQYYRSLEHLRAILVANLQEMIRITRRNP